MWNSFQGKDTKRIVDRVESDIHVDVKLSALQAYTWQAIPFLSVILHVEALIKIQEGLKLNALLNYLCHCSSLPSEELSGQRIYQVY